MASRMNWISFSVGCGRAVISVLLSADHADTRLSISGLAKLTQDLNRHPLDLLYIPYVMHAEMPCTLLVLLKCQTCLQRFELE